MVSINTNNGTERQNESLKYQYLKDHNNNSLSGVITTLAEEFCQINTEGTEVSKIDSVILIFTILRRGMTLPGHQKSSKIAQFEALGIKTELLVFLGIPSKSFKFPKKFKLLQRSTLQCQAPQTLSFCHF